MLHGLQPGKAAAAALFMAALGACDAPPAPAWEDPLDQDAPLFDLPPIQWNGPAIEGQAELEKDAEYCDTEAPAEKPNPDLRLYATWQRFPLTQAEHGIDGTLRVLQDSRFTGPDFERRGTHPMIRPCDKLPGLIEVLDAGGRPVDAWETSPQTTLSARSFAPGQTLYVVTNLVQCLASCWCGDHVSFVRVEGGRLKTLETVRSTGEARPVNGVTNGCYEGGGVRRDDQGRFEVYIYRKLMGPSGGLSVEEHHGWDGDAWRGSVIERKSPW